MKHVALFLAALLLLSACGAGETPPPAATTAPLVTTVALGVDSAHTTVPATEATAPPGELAEIALVKSWFENPDSRDIYVDGLDVIDGIFHTIVEVAGDAGGERYILATFAIQLEGNRRYYTERADDWMDAPDDAWERFQNDPWFAVADSPDGQYRMEAIGMWLDGPSGFHSMDRIRLISLMDGTELWTEEHGMRNSFHWSPDSRFVSATHWGRIWAETFVVDTEDMGVIEMPTSQDLCALDPDIPPMKAVRGDPYVVARGWQRDTVLILDIQWIAEDYRQVDVICTVDVLSGVVEIVEFSAHQVG